MNPRGVDRNIDMVNIEDTNNKWRDIGVFHLIDVTAGLKIKIILQNTGGMLERGIYNQILIKKKLPKIV